VSQDRQALDQRPTPRSETHKNLLCLAADGKPWVMISAKDANTTTSLCGELQHGVDGRFGNESAVGFEAAVFPEIPNPAANTRVRAAARLVKAILGNMTTGGGHAVSSVKNGARNLRNFASTYRPHCRPPAGD
jgi:hypothetical protein